MGLTTTNEIAREKQRQRRFLDSPPGYSALLIHKQPKQSAVLPRVLRTRKQVIIGAGLMDKRGVHCLRRGRASSKRALFARRTDFTHAT